MPREIQKMAFAVLIFSEGFGQVLFANQANTKALGFS